MALAQGGVRNFDHLRTGFALTGAHASTRCEACHINGIFRGTPRDCASCHTSGARFARGNAVKPSNHPPTNLGCDACHNTSTYVGAKFNHTGIAAGSCATCHNGATASGKSPNHVATTASCDACHRVTAWRPAGFNHASVAAGTCATCHNGTTATGKTPTHIPTTASCDTCHRTTAWTPTSFNHTGVAAGSCATCHNGTQASGKPGAGHIPTTAACDSCHTSTSSWLPVPPTFNHAGIAPGSCSSCHGGSFGNIDVKSPSHITTTQPCDLCHRTTAWKPATFDHTGVAAGACATCHNGTQATGKPTSGHIPTTQACDTCHTSTSTWLPVPPTYNHTGIAPGTCNSCHGGTYPNIDVKSASHITTTAQCDTCHRTTAWTPATFSHTAVAAGSCATCHNGTQATGKPTSGHIPTTQACDACHTSTTSWLPVPATYNHTGVAPSTCNTCHGGSYGNIDVKTASHLTTTQQCDVCHRTTAWTPATFSHTGIAAGTCATCHNGTQATGKPAGHIVTTASCDACHSTAAWKPANFSHTNVTPGTCNTCHNGTQATGKDTTHIPTTASCDSCHNTTAWKPATMNHTVVAATPCKTCHNGAYVSKGTTGALAKPANHIPENTQLLNGAAMDCNACHVSTSTWTSETMNHNGSQGNGSGWCIGCHQTGTSYLGSMRKMQLNHRNRTPPPTDCSQSGCHRPLGNTGSTYRNWD